MQLSQAFIQFEPGIHSGENCRVHWQREGFVLAVENPQPRHASLTNLALTVVENSVAGSRGMLRVRSRSDLRYGLLGHSDCTDYALVSALFQATSLSPPR